MDTNDTQVKKMFIETTPNKGMIFLLGLITLLVGLYVFNSPVKAVVTFVTYIAIVKFISGLMGLFAYSKDKEQNQLFVSIIDLLFGLLLLVSFGALAMTIAALPYFLGIWVIIRSCILMYFSFKTKKVVSNWWVFFIINLFSLIAGFVILAYPYASTVLIVQYVGFFLIFMGSLSVIQSIIMFVKK